MRIRKPLHYILVCILTALGINLFAILLPPSPSNPVGPSVALAQTAKQKARAAYRKQAKKLARANKSSGRRYARYRFADVYGGSGEEMLVVTPPMGAAAAICAFIRTRPESSSCFSRRVCTAMSGITFTRRAAHSPSIAQVMAAKDTSTTRQAEASTSSSS